MEKITKGKGMAILAMLNVQGKIRHVWGAYNRWTWKYAMVKQMMKKTECAVGRETDIQNEHIVSMSKTANR